MVAERFGKAIRTPARDAMLSHATTAMGRGWGFGLHEAMDQIGALLGPLLVAAVLFRRKGYAIAFGVLLIPALLTLGVLVLARLLYPDPRDFEIGTPPLETQGFPRIFWLYLVAIGLIAAGYADFPLIAYHFQMTSLASEWWIPLFYAVAMGVDAVAALGYPVVAGLSRKSTLGALTGRASGERLPASLAAALAAVAHGAAIVRVHDVRATVDALKVWSAIHAA